MTRLKTASRQTEVVSVSLEPEVYRTLEQMRRRTGQNRSRLVAQLVRQQSEEERWQKLYRRGQETARRFQITSEEDVEKILNEK